MKHLKTNSKESLVGERPLFSSTWLALFTVLRKNYNERNLVATPDTENSTTAEKKQSEIKLDLL